MVDTTSYREKYTPRIKRNGVKAFPPGGRDVIRLCVQLERMEALVRELQRDMLVSNQNEIESRLFLI